MKPTLAPRDACSQATHARLRRDPEAFARATVPIGYDELVEAELANCLSCGSTLVLDVTTGEAHP